jgi:hypothetical protein
LRDFFVGTRAADTQTHAARVRDKVSGYNRLNRLESWIYISQTHVCTRPKVTMTKQAIDVVMKVHRRATRKQRRAKRRCEGCVRLCI